MTRSRRSHRGASVSLARLRFGVALAATVATVATVARIAPAAAHSAVNSVHSVAFGADGSRVMIVSFGVIHRAPNAAPSWQCPAAFGASADALNRTVTAHQGGFLLLSDGGVRRSNDGRCAWTPEVLPNGLALQLAATGDALWLLLDDNGTSTLLRRQIATWVPTATPAGLVIEGVHAGPGSQRLWLAGQLDGKGVVALSDDAGITWRTRALPPATFEQTRFSPLAGHPSQPDLLLVRAHSALKVDRLLRSLDDGETWAEILAPNAGIDVSAAVWLPGAATGTLLVGGASAGIWRSVDSGSTFTKISNGPRVGCLLRDGKRAYACADEFAWGAALLVSDDDGKTWAPDFCFAAITGPAACQPSCAAGWPAVVAAHGIQTGHACGLGGVAAPDNDAGSDTAASGDAALGDTAASDPDQITAAPKPLVARAQNTGCHSGASPGRGRPWSALLVVATVYLLIRRRRSPTMRGPCA